MLNSNPSVSGADSVARQQTKRLKRTLGAAGVSLFLCVWLAAGALLGQVHWNAVLYSLAWVAICSTAFLTLIDYGVNLKFSDPSMTQAMILAASVCVLVNAVFMTDAAWSAIGVFIIVAFSFSTFKGSRAWLLRLCGAIVAMISIAVMARSYMVGNGLFTLWQSIPMVATMLALAIYGGLLNEVKNKARQQQILANLTLENLSEAILNLSPDGRIVAINQYACAMLKRDPTQLIGIKLERLLDSITPVGDDNTAISLLATASSIPLTTKHRQAIKSRFAICVDGDELQIESTTSRVFDHDGTAISQLVILRDITDHMALLSQLNYAATHDPLTGLLNRRGFDDAAAKVERELLLARSEAGFGLCVIDLDHLKLINDSCGHAAGDQFLIQVSKTLSAGLRINDVLARVGGDEFAIILSAKDNDELQLASNRFIEAIKAQGFSWDGRSFPTTASGGCILLDSKKPDIPGALAQADAALYLAKEQGRAHMQIFSSENAEIELLNDQVKLASKLLSALEKDHFELYAQRIVAPGAQPGEYVEVLLRLNDAEHGVLLPGAFLPAAERFGLMPAIDRWVVRKTVVAIDCQIKRNGFLRKVAINLSAHTLQDSDFLAFVRSQFERFPQVRAWVAFELTETVAVSNLARAKEFIQSIRAMGCEFALDDVGAGFNSLGYLKEMRFDKIKIDGYYIRHLQTDHVNRTIVDSIIKAALSLDITTVAEMVETESLAHELTEMGIDFMQGYHFHKPEPLEAVLIATQAPETSAQMEFS